VIRPTFTLSDPKFITVRFRTLKRKKMNEDKERKNRRRRRRKRRREDEDGVKRGGR
jgi:hypothetical protein